MGAGAAAGDATPPDPAAVSSTGEKQSEPGGRPHALLQFFRRTFIVVDPEMSPEVVKVLEDVGWNHHPAQDLAAKMQDRSTTEMKSLRNIVVLVPVMAVILGFTTADLVTTETIWTEIRETWGVLVWIIVSTLIVIAGTWQYTFDHHIVKARLLGHLLRALAACIELETNPLDIRLRGRVARNIHAASSRFDFVYRRLPGYRARTYGTELENRAAAGAQAIASMTALLFAGTDAIPDLRDRLARAILRIEPEDWTTVVELGTGSEVPKRTWSLRRLLEPATVALIVGGLTLITPVVSLVSNLVD